MHEAEERQHRTGRRKVRCFRVLLVDDEHAGGAEYHAAEDGSGAQHLKSVVEHADLAEFVEADRRRIGPGRPERAVDQELAPGRDVRDQRQNDRRRMVLRRLLERLRANQHADVEQDRRDRDQRNQRRHHRDNAEP